MTIIKEYRIVMPLTMDEYNIGLLYTVIEASKNTTGGGEGIEWVENRHFNDKTFMNGRYNSGQYTSKVYHLDKKLPSYIRSVLSANNRCADEAAWNAYPYCMVQVKPRVSAKFNIYIESMHLANDRGTAENALQLSPEMLAKREVVYIDIVNDKLNPNEYKANEDPSKYRSVKGRGELRSNWRETCEPVMCCYKLVHVQCAWTLFGGMIEGFIAKQFPRIFLNGHRQMYCSMDRWLSLSIAEIRNLEDESMIILRKLRAEGKPRGIAAVE